MSAQIHSFLSLSTKPEPPKIKFIGVFDTVKAVDDGRLHDISFHGTTQHLRHALALNEDRRPMEPEYVFPDFSHTKLQLSKRSIVQAWFIGAHIDMGGSAKRDGLSLYPLQWMLFESESKGLVLEFSRAFLDRTAIDDPLRVVRPEREEDGKGFDTCICTIENGVEVWMHDLHQVHELEKYRERYAIHLNRQKAELWPKKAREPFTANGTLRGYCSFGRATLSQLADYSTHNQQLLKEQSSTLPSTSSWMRIYK